MGVKLGAIVPRRQITFEELYGKKIAVDASNTLFQFLSSIRQPDGTPLMDSQGRITSHLMGIWSRFSNLLQKNVQIAVVFDGKPPALKFQEQQARRERKEVAKEKYERAKEKENQAEMAKYAKQLSFLNKELLEESKQLIDAMGIPVIQAPSESDAQMVYMNKKDDVYACGSSDFDCLVHGGPRLIPNLTASQRKKLPSGEYKKVDLEVIELNLTLKTLGITQEQLICLAILSGTDYNTGGMKGIGPKKALKLIKERKTPEKIFEGLDVGGDWKEIFSLFVSMDVEKKYSLAYKDLDEEKIKKILVEEHEFSAERVETVLNNLKEGKESRSQTGLGRWT